MNEGNNKFAWVLAIVLIGCGLFYLQKLIQENTKTVDDIRAEQKAAAKDGDSLRISREDLESLLRESQDKVNKTEKESGAIEEIGKWYDGLAKDIFHLYKENGKIYLDLGYLKIECKLQTIKGKEFVFQDNDGTFYMEKGVKVYVGYGFEEMTDSRGDYSTNVIMRVSGNKLYVYTNDIDRRYYQELCIARKL